MLQGRAQPADRLSLRGLFPISAAGAVLLAGVTLSLRVSLLQHDNDVSQMHHQVTSELDKVRGDLSRELFASVNLTQGLVSLVRIQGGISQQQFDAMADGLVRQTPIIRNIALAPGNVIRFVYPRRGNEGALGLDYMKTPDQREAVLRAIGENRLIVAGPVNLVQGGVGIVARAPIYRGSANGAGKSAAYWGVSATVIDFNTLIRAAGLLKTTHLRFALRGKDGRGPDGEIFWGDSSIFTSDPVTMDVDLPSGSWQIAAIPASGWPAFAAYASFPFQLGLVISVFLALLTYLSLWMNQARGLEVEERQSAEAALRQTNRTLQLFSRCNSAVVQATDEGALLTEICRIAVECAGYRMAWVGRIEQDEAKTVRPVAFAGPGEGFLDRIHVSWAEDKYGRGTAGRAIRSGKSSIARDLLSNPDFAEWRDVLATRDFAAAIAVPLIVDGQVVGVLLIYAAEADAFDNTEVGLLDEMGRNISHGMSALRAQKERAAAMAALEQARNELEDRVAERTRALSAKNAELVDEIERRTKVENTLHESNEKYRELVDNANSIILRIDTTGRVTFFNEFAQKFFGYTDREIIGQSLSDTIVPGKDSSGHGLLTLVDEICTNPEKYARHENENMKKGGERVWIAWTNKPIFDSSGKLAEVLCIGNDISSLKKTETELLRAKEAAESADRIKSAFLATMSHELRTPLNSIIGFTGILLQGLPGPLNDEQKKQLGMVKNAACHLLDLINDVLDISKIEAGQLEVRSEPFDLCAAVEKVMQTFRPLAEKKGLRLDLQTEPEISQIVGDRRRVEQVLMNLLSNAVKFTDSGAVTIRCGTRSRHAEVSVSDTGIGIRPEDQEAIFQPFHQVDNGLTRSHEGTGLGLSISRRLLELMGGSIRLESEPGEGSTFTFSLPLPGETNGQYHTGY